MVPLVLSPVDLPIPMESQDRSSFVSTTSIKTSPNTIHKLVLRVRALTLELLPVQVSVDSLKDPTSRIISKSVVNAYAAAAGDFLEALPFALLRAQRTFVRDAMNNIADWDENMGRATACEVLARRIVHNIGPDRLNSVMSTRYRYLEADGDPSNPSSALEYAVDRRCTIFLSSNESQLVMKSLWDGHLVQKYNKNDDIDYVPFEEVRKHGFWGHIEPSRLSVPRYQNMFRICIWLFFLLTYSQAVRQPLARLDPRRQSMDVWEYILYIMSFAFTFEEVYKAWIGLYMNIHLFTWRAVLINFWTSISIITLALLMTAFGLRVAGIFTEDADGALHLRSFQVLSCVAPLICDHPSSQCRVPDILTELITVFDGVKYIGTMQICVGSMLQESTIFFALLALLFAGFLQAMIALDASDGETERGTVLINSLIQALLQSPDFEKPGTNTFGLILYYFWNFANTVILLNILVSLFASAYQTVVDDAEAEYLAFFANKTVALIRAPDQYVYPPPFNFIEILFVIPFEPLLSQKNYAKLNRYVMIVIFFLPLCVLAFFESLDKKSGYLRNWFGDSGLDELTAETLNPTMDDEDGLEISKVRFKDLIKDFPNTSLSSDETLLQEIRTLQRRVEELAAKIAAN
ncbi:calcium activated cation channel [Hysterangium stoloniferum]|nr:calcium activated cation channel [Hysterangium stoloniferum]